MASIWAGGCMPGALGSLTFCRRFLRKTVQNWKATCKGDRTGSARQNALRRATSFRDCPKTGMRSKPLNNPNTLGLQTWASYNLQPTIGRTLSPSLLLPGPVAYHLSLARPGSREGSRTVLVFWTHGCSHCDGSPLVLWLMAIITHSIVPAIIQLEPYFFHSP